MREADLYPLVERWMKRRFGCFATGINTGTKHGRIDVAGIRPVGGDLSGEAEVISIEVKAGRQPFATAAGQAVGYSVCCDRTYLADIRPKRPQFTADEQAIASKLGIGLLALTETGRVVEVQSSPQHRPLVGLRLQVIHAMHYAECTICSVVFKRGESDAAYKHVQRDGARGGLAKAVRDDKGFMFWNTEASGRDGRDRGQLYHRRYVCPDCVQGLFRSSSRG